MHVFSGIRCGNIYNQGNNERNVMKEGYKILLGAGAGLLASLIIILYQENQSYKESDRIALETKIQKEYGKTVDSLFKITRDENRSLRKSLGTVEEALKGKGGLNILLTAEAIQVIEDTIEIDTRARDSIYQKLKQNDL
jgi:hypothetical protein